MKECTARVVNKLSIVSLISNIYTITLSGLVNFIKTSIQLFVHYTLTDIGNEETLTL